MGLIQNLTQVLKTNDKILFNLFIFLFIIGEIIFLIGQLKKIKLYTNTLLAKKLKDILLVNTLFILLCTIIIILLFYTKTLNIHNSIIFLTIYYLTNFYFITQKINIENIKSELEESKLHNASLESLYNSISGFRHDFSNIITSLGGLIYAKDIDKITDYYNKLLAECNINNNLSALNSNVINNPAIYNIIASKYHTANEFGITVNLQIFINFNNFNLEIYDFSRILGIFLDNAIEATNSCEEKIINIDIRDIKPNRCQIVTIENTYSNKDIDINNLSQKGYTSKTNEKEKHGIGLWQVSKILNKHSNVKLETSKNDKFFKQELFINY